MLININEIKVSDRIRKDFGNIQELADDIKQNGLINPPVVTPDNYELIAGERRLRAMKLLGYNQIEVRPMAVKDAEHQLNLEISENETRKDFSKAERIDYARRLERVESLKARERQATLTGGSNPQLTQNFVEAEKGEVVDIVAEKLNIGSGEQYRKEKFIVENKSNLSTEDFAEWDEGKLSTNKVFLKIKEQLKEKENQIFGYELKLKTLEDKPPKLIDNTDYNTINTLKIQVSNKEKDIEILKKEKELLERRVKLNQEDADKYAKLKKDIDFLNQQKSDLSRRLTSATELAELTVKLQKVLENDLSPIKYKRCIEVLDTSDIAVENLSSIISSVENWLNEIKNYLPNKNINYTSYIDVKGE